MATRGLGDLRLADSGLYRPLQHEAVSVMTPDEAGTGILRQLRGRKDILPDPLPMGVRVFSLQRIGQVDMPCANLEIGLMELFDGLEVLLEGILDLLRQHRHPVLLAFAITHYDLVIRKVHVFHAQAHTLHQPQACSIEQRGHDPRRPPSCRNTAATSSDVSTTGIRCGCLARTTSSIQPMSCLRTC